MSDRPGAVVIGGDFQGVGVLHSLGRRGVRTMLVDSDACIGRFSRYADGFARCPSPEAEDGRALVSFLLHLADRRGLRGWVLFPNDDTTVRVLSQHKRRLERVFRVPVPEWETLRLFADKRETYELARSAAVGVPAAFFPDVHEDPAEHRLRYPVVVKPRVRDPFYGLTKKKAVRAQDADELRSAWEWASGFVPAEQLMVQEMIEGGTDVLYSLGAYFRHGRLKAHVVAHRRRQHPMDFGRATTYAETVAIPQIEALGSTLLDAAGYEGLAEVEFMLDHRDGAFKLLEVNPRVWGWHTLAHGAGVDLPYLFFLDAAGEGAPVVPSYEQGVKWLRPITDLPTGLREVARGRLGLREYLSSLRGVREIAPSFSLDDPGPFLMEFLFVPYLLVKRGF